VSAVVTTKAVIDVLNERAGQIRREGWSHAHDDTHDRGQMAFAAASYAESAGRSLSGPEHACLAPLVTTYPPASWPWAGSWWKPRTPREDLVRAAALIIAEIERIDRKVQR
jgi:hypothetical protein